MAKLSEKAKEKKAKRDIEYRKGNVKNLGLHLNKNTMADVIEWLDTKDNKQGYVIDLIRKDILANQKWRNEVINIMKTYNRRELALMQVEEARKHLELVFNLLYKLYKKDELEEIEDYYDTIDKKLIDLKYEIEWLAKVEPWYTRKSKMKKWGNKHYENLL